MKGFTRDIEGLAIGNEAFRRVLNTATHCRLAVMAVKPGKAVLDGEATSINAGPRSSCRREGVTTS